MSGPYWYNGQYHEEKCQKTSAAQDSLEKENEKLRSENEMLHQQNKMLLDLVERLSAIVKILNE